MEQHVHAVAGHAYGAIGADIHIFGNSAPVYLLFRHRTQSPPPPQVPWVPPSHLLDARAETVPFSGREDDVAALLDWRDQPCRVAARWLHGQAGQGKTRLARHLAGLSGADGWLVVEAVQGTDTHPPKEGSQDLRPDGHRGVLLIVDYADRWPVSHLSWLFQNRLLWQDIPVRVLLLARAAEAWPAVRSKLTKLRAGIETSAHALPDLSDEDGAREAMFSVARDGFAHHYPALTAADLRGIQPPSSLRRADFGVTLAVHMAALAAVDARARGHHPPDDVLGLTIYMLDREHENWRQLHENDPASFMSDREMARLVFVATLTGPLRREAAAEVLDKVAPELPIERVLADHAACYPATDPSRANVLEPLVPDRLAEDFLALMLGGHGRPDYEPDPWCDGVPAALFATAFLQPYPAYAPRILTYLNAASERWPHLLGVLTELYPLLPRHEHLTLDVPAAQVIIKVAGAAEQDGDAAARRRLAWAYSRLGQTDDAVREAEQAVDILRNLADDDPDEWTPSLGRALTELGTALHAHGHPNEAVAATREAVNILRRCEDTSYASLRSLAPALDNLGAFLGAMGRHEEAAVAAREAVAIRRRLTAAPSPQISEVDGIRVANINVDRSNFGDEVIALATALDNLSMRLGVLDLPAEALVPAAEALEIRHRLAADDPDAHDSSLARSLHNTALWLRRLGLVGQALDLLKQADTIRRRLAVVNPAVYRTELAATQHLLEELSCETAPPDPGPPLLAELAGRTGDEAALVVHERALDVARQRGHRRNEAALLVNLTAVLRRLGRIEEAIAACERALALLDDPHALAQARGNLGSALRDAGRLDEAVMMLERAVADFITLDERGEAGIALNNLALAHLDAGKPTQARAAARQAVEFHQDLGDQPGEALARLSLCKALSVQGEHQAAISALEATAALAETLHDREITAEATGVAGDLLLNMGRHREARAAFAEAADVYEELGDQRGLARAEYGWGLAMACEGDPRGAVAHLGRARDLGERHLRADALQQLGTAYSEFGAFIPASTALTQAAALLRELDEPARRGRVLAELAAVQQRDTCYEAALETAREALAVCRTQGDRDGERSALHTLALALRHLDHLEEALAVHSEEITLCRQLGVPDETADALNDYGTTLRHAGRYRQSLIVLKAAARVYRQLGAVAKLEIVQENRALTRRARLRLGGATAALIQCYARLKAAEAARHLAAGRLDQAVSGYGMSHELSVMARDRRQDGLALLGLGRALLEKGEYDEAAKAGDYAAQIFRYRGETTLERRGIWVREESLRRSPHGEC